MSDQRSTFRKIRDDDPGIHGFFIIACTIGGGMFLYKLFKFFETGGARTPVLRGVTFAMQPGEFLVARGRFEGARRRPLFHGRFAGDLSRKGDSLGDFSCRAYAGPETTR